MLIDNTIIEETLKGLLQSNIKMNLKNKTFKKGKLILFRQNNYHLELTIEIKDGVTKKFEIPIPFDVESWDEDGLVYFDYRLSTLSKGNSKFYHLVKTLPKIGNNKFYDTILEIEVN